MAALNPTYTDLARHTLEPLGWTVTIDAKESRFPSAAIEVLKARRAEIGDVVVIHMSNNYLDDEALWAQQIDDMFATLTGVKRFIFINVTEFRPDRAQVNEQLRAALVRHPNMVLLDWNALTKANPSYTGSDHLHLSLAGARAYAAMIADGLGPVRLPPTPAAAHSLLRRS